MTHSRISGSRFRIQQNVKSTDRERRITRPMMEGQMTGPIVAIGANAFGDEFDSCGILLKSTIYKNEHIRCE
jgi:hypothetical protein